MIMINIYHGNTKINGNCVNKVYYKAIDYPMTNPTINPIKLELKTKVNASII